MKHLTMLKERHPKRPCLQSQERLDAAIAFFRSEASASGYVVEEVRLCRPALEIDILPRVVIAQHTAAGPILPPIYPPAKLIRRAHPPTPQSPPSDQPMIEALAQASASNQSIMLMDRLTDRSPRAYPLGSSHTSGMASAVEPLEGGIGLKRTVSGSVIVKSHTVFPESHGQEESAERGRMQFSSVEICGLRDEPNMLLAECKRSHEYGEGEEDVPKNGMWGGPHSIEESKTPSEGPAPTEEQGHGSTGEDAAKESPEAADREYAYDSGSESEEMLQRREPTAAEEREENRPVVVVKKATADVDMDNHCHGIPESHVQLFLSSVATISERERECEERESNGLSGIAVEDVRSGGSEDHDEDETKEGRPPALRAEAEDEQGREVGGSRRRHASTSKGHQANGGNSDRLATRTSSAARPFKCHKCSSSFDRDGHLRVHILAVHEKKKPFVCQVCNAAFGHSSSLLRHVRTVHQASPAIGSGRIGNYLRSSQRRSESGVRASGEISDEYQECDERHFRCSVCRKTFSRVALLNRHVAVKHPIRSPGLDERGIEANRSDSD